MERRHDGPDPETAGRAALGVLQARIAPGRDVSGACLPFGVPEIDGALPGGGLCLGPPHEIVPDSEGDAVAALGFAFALLARQLAEGPGEALLALGPGYPLPYGHGLAGLGLDPGRLLFLQGASDAEVLRAVEAALHARTLRAVAALLDGGLPLVASRRLLLADGGALLLVLRPARADLPNGAATRWRIASAAAARDRFGRALRPRWRARLERCRNGRTGDWIMDWDHAAHRFALPDRLADHAPAAGGHGPR